MADKAGLGKRRAGDAPLTIAVKINPWRPGQAVQGPDWEMPPGIPTTDGPRSGVPPLPWQVKPKSGSDSEK